MVPRNKGSWLKVDAKGFIPSIPIEIGFQELKKE
jgi:hypothetical protein